MTDPRENVHRNFGGQAKHGDIAPYVLVPGSKNRVEKFIKFWDNPRKIADHYAFLLYTGTYKGIPISACSTGIGGTSVSIAVEELSRLGAKTFLRVGVTSPLRDELSLGEIVIAQGAVRWDGASLDYVRPEYPALAHFEVVMAAITAAESLQAAYKVGIIGDMASLGPMREDGYRKFLYQRTDQMRQALYDVGVIDGTGESAVLFIQASLYGFRAGTILINGADKVKKQWNPEVEDTIVQIGLETIKILAEWDKKKRNFIQKFIIPSYPSKIFNN